MTVHSVLLILALACTFMAFIRKPDMPVAIGWLGVFFLLLDMFLVK